MRIAVTGGSGSLGVAVVDALVSEGHHVLSLDLRPRQGDAPPELELAQADIRDEGALTELFRRHRTDTVVHLAAALPVAANADLREALDINVAGVETVVAAAAAVGGQRFVHLSSKAVYGRPEGRYGHPTYEPVPLTLETAPVDNYGITKLAGEHVLRRELRAHGMSGVIFRLASTFGPGKSERHGALSWINALIDAAVANERVSVRCQPGAATDLIYDRDVAAAVVAAVAALRDLEPGIRTLHLASGRATTVAEVCETLNSVVGRPVAELSIDEPPAPGTREVVVPATGLLLDLGPTERLLGPLPTHTLRDAVSDFIARTTAMGAAAG